MALTRQHEDLLLKVYNKEKFLFGRDKLYQYLRENYTSFPSRRQVMQWLKSQQVYQLHQRPPLRVPTKSVAVSKPNKYFQADLTGPLPRDQGYNYVFAIIDVNSKMLFTRPLKTKTAAEVASALSEVIAANNLTISVIQSDNGTEFHGEFQELLQQRGIKQIFSQTASPWTNGVIERSHGTWKQMMYKYWSMSKTKKWKAILPSLTSKTLKATKDCCKKIKN
jgi:transposase InsO family protein